MLMQPVAAHFKDGPAERSAAASILTRWQKALRASAQQLLSHSAHFPCRAGTGIHGAIVTIAWNALQSDKTAISRHAGLLPEPVAACGTKQRGLAATTVKDRTAMLLPLVPSQFKKVPLPTECRKVQID